MSRLLFFSFIIFFININNVFAATETMRFYSDPGSEGITTDGRMFEDRYSDWSQTINASSARTTNYSTDNGSGITNALGSGNGPLVYSNTRLHFGFDTSSIPDNAQILSAQFYIHSAHVDEGAGSEKRFYLVSSNPTLNNNLSESDYAKVGDISYGVTDGTWSLESYHYIDLNTQGLSWIDKSNVTNFALRGWFDFNEVAPTDENEQALHVYFVDQEGVSSDPYLEVTYAVETGGKDMCGLVRELIVAVEGYGFPKNIENNYIAHLKKVEDMLCAGKYRSAEKQMHVFIEKLHKDLKKKNITVTQYNDLLSKAKELCEDVDSTKTSHHREKNECLPKR